MKKRILLVLLALVILVTCAFVSCKKDKGDNNDDSGSTNTDTSTDTGTVECTHNWGEGTVTTTPTCRANGEKTFTCSLCSETKTETIYSSKSYCVYGDEPTITQPDCKTETDGKIEYLCTVCGTADPSRPVDKIDWEHDIADEPIVKPATCDAPGYSITYCKVCFDLEKFETEMSMVGVEEYTTLPANGHTWETVSSDPATCAGPEILHQKCSGCESTQDVQGEPALEHDYEGQPEKIKQPNCLEDGYKYKECKNCGEEDITGMDDSLKATGHKFDYSNPEYIIRVEATCITDGSVTPKCTAADCDYVGSVDVPGEVQVLPATGLHYTTYDESAVVPATCHRNAYTTWSCTADEACTETKEVEQENTKLAHETEFVRTIEPRCDAYGYDLWVCKHCPHDNPEECKEAGCVEEKNIVEIDHKFSEIVPNTFNDSTCQYQATVDYICEDCQGQYTYTYPVAEADGLPTVDGKTFVPLKEHIRDAAHIDNWVKTEDITAPTCTAEGFTAYSCKFSGGECGETYNLEITMRTQHSFTAYKDGRLVCADCGITYRDITTYNSTPIASSGDASNGPLTFTDANGDEISLDWEVIGYGAPAAPTAVVAGTPAEITTFKLPMKEGVVELKLVDGLDATITVNDTVYTVAATYNTDNSYYNVVITRGDVSATLTVYGAYVYVDLYANTDDVTSITVATDVDTEFALYAKQ
jgi:hypothetical protein